MKKRSKKGRQSNPISLHVLLAYGVQAGAALASDLTETELAMLATSLPASTVVGRYIERRVCVGGPGDPDAYEAMIADVRRLLAAGGGEA